ncbi:hypothetical protein N2601_28960 (plasmid) [Rhizobium sp. CB3060]|uniref:hypothetical protein n=1 Tax=Rhizobium sp. CB3060 TaxID=3138255 RepID=UPI0021A2CE38|nr:hypothetical protein [Rhizobium tropici]UWU24252.1 hypothetical protein N2601_28960 [Rhizobium tropici]
MRHVQARKLVALFLAVLVAAGMSLTVVRASAVAAQMATMSAIDMPDHGGCPDCPGKADDNGMKAIVCSTVCISPLIAPLPLAAVVPDGEKVVSAFVSDLLLHGRNQLPEPDPPRTSDIG